ncbi:MAG: hypothetical protein ACRCZI_09455, partial [Cetobacterium sp.]
MDTDRSADPSKLFHGMTLNPQIKAFSSEFAKVQGPVKHDADGFGSRGSFDPGYRYGHLSANAAIVSGMKSLARSVEATAKALVTPDDAYIAKQARKLQ